MTETERYLAAEGTVIIGDRAVTIKEMSVKQILHLFGLDLSGKQTERKAPDLSLDTFAGRLRDFLSMCAGLTLEDAEGFTPSQLQGLYKKFKEVNAGFFEGARVAKMQETLNAILAQIRVSIVSDFSAMLANSQRRGTPMSGATAIPGSASHGKNTAKSGKSA